MCITCTCTYVHVLTCIMYKKISMLLDRLHDNNCKKHEYCYSCVYLHTRVLCVCSIDIVQCYNINSHCIPLYSPHLALLCVLHTHTHTHTHTPHRDTAGQERFETLTAQYYRRAQV